MLEALCTKLEHDAEHADQADQAEIGFFGDTGPHVYLYIPEESPDSLSGLPDSTL